MTLGQGEENQKQHRGEQGSKEKEEGNNCKVTDKKQIGSKNLTTARLKVMLRKRGHLQVGEKGGRSKFLRHHRFNETWVIVMDHQGDAHLKGRGMNVINQKLSPQESIEEGGSQ